MLAVFGALVEAELVSEERHGKAIAKALDAMDEDDGIAALANLVRLDLDSHGCPTEGELRDLAPLANMSALEDIWLCDCSNADALLTLPKLKLVRLHGRIVIEPAGVVEALKAKGVEVEGFLQR